MKTWIAALLAVLFAGSAAAAEFDIGLAGSGARIDGVEVEASASNAPTVVLVGGLVGNDAGTAAVHTAVAAYEKDRSRPVRLLAVPLANPDGAAAQFPPTGIAYREHAESHVLWRWLGAQAPDLVLIAGDDAGLAAALAAQPVGDVGSIPALRWSGAPDWVKTLGRIGKSPAHAELERRLARTPRQLAEQLAQHYGHDFDQPVYINAIALVARLKLGELDDVKHLAEPWVDGTKNSLARPSSLVMAGHIVFTELARRTRDPRYTALVRRVADLGFDASGQMLEAMPYNDGYSDSVFMGTTILAQAGALTGEQQYFDMADRHLRYMEELDLRPDGLYRHRPAADVPWGRGNGFAALGLALTLTELPRGSAAYRHALESYRNLMQALLPWQTRDGLWRNVVNHPGSYPEFSGTAMIGFALQRGLKMGWIKGREYQQAVDRAWIAVNSRASPTGSLIDVCESTAGITTEQQYLQRAAILGMDARGGAMAMLFATERMH
ncbi:MAG TPA: glycoside hydrolase family 88 protein [Steroidobacteraceae bacterium]|nr:glycoside hydrolase family 88 protein [Steroidobacteraceae bacterium]